MKVKTYEKYNAVIIELKGNVMGGPHAQELSDLLHSFINDNKKNIVVDLGDVKFMNSSGLGMLISSLTTMTNAGGQLVLSNVTDKIESLLVITKLITIFKHFESVDEAVNSFV